MDGSSRAFASPMSIDVNGRKYLVGAFDVGVYGTLEQEVLRRRPSAIDLAKSKLEGLPPELQETLLLRAWEEERSENKATSEDVANFIRSTEGTKFLIWLLIRKLQPDFEYAEIEKASESLDFLLEATQVFRQMSGTDDRGKPTGQTRAFSTEASLAEAASRSRGGD